MTHSLLAKTIAGIASYSVSNTASQKAEKYKHQQEEKKARARKARRKGRR